MSKYRISRSLSASIADVLGGSHAVLDALFLSAGAPPPPPDLAHHTKWKTWIFQAGQDASVDSLEFIGNLIEEFMDIPPNGDIEDFENWNEKREKLTNELESFGLRYFRGGRVLPNGQDGVDAQVSQSTAENQRKDRPQVPDSIEDVLKVLVCGLPRAMHPLAQRRKGADSLSFSSEYDVQDLLHSLLRPWVGDIRPEEFTPSYAGSSTRMDFLLPKHSLVIELKFVRDRAHGRKIGDELIIDIEHYRRHPQCDTLWCVIYDPSKLLQNAEGLMTDLAGNRSTSDGDVLVKVVVI